MRKLFFISLLLTVQLTTSTNRLLGQTSIKAQTGYYTNDNHYLWSEEWYKINDSIMSVWSCCDSSDGLKFAVFDSASCIPWISPGIGTPYFDFNGAYHCQPYSTTAFDFYIDSTDSSQNIIANFINSIPQKDYVLVMSHKNHYCEQWNSNLIIAFRSIGSTVDISNRFMNGTPYIMFGKKGSVPGSATQTIGTTSGDLILLYDSLPCNPNSIVELSADLDISIIPNPTSDQITVTVLHNATIEITNINGQIVKTIDTFDKNTIVDLRNLSCGVYIASVRTDNKIVTKKIIKE